MTSTYNPSEACCSIPPVLVEYTPKGSSDKPLGEFDRVYVTGDKSEPDIALIIVYDIFGFASQTLQGADILAAAVGARVFIPDFFGEGNAFPFAKYPARDEETKKELAHFFKNVANPPVTATRLVEFASFLRGEGFKKIGALGYCFGGNVVTLAALTEDSSLDAIAVVHPGKVTPNDAKNLTIPLGVYFSKDENREHFDEIVKELSKKSFAEKVGTTGKYYPNMFHGWAAARANLSDPENKMEYEDLYSNASGFFKRALA